MSDDKTEGFDEENSGESSGGSAPRARNRTVMLTPDITDEVRSRIKQDLSGGGGESSHSQPSRSEPDSGFVTPTPRGLGGGAMKAPAPTPAAPRVQPRGVAPISQSGDQVVWSKNSKLIGFLISYDKNEDGEYFELRAGRLIVSSEPAGSGSYLVLGDESVSPMHAVLKFAPSGPAQVLDQLSENGTKIESKDGTVQELSGEKGEVRHGDVLSFGDRSFHLCLIFGESD